ncbi:MAG TPA: hypothetical protein VGQ30_10345 [Gemmatimonadaceae bacterium]|nr:hypothetical protein [Gemmatimonadaceae bacterium]
MTRRTIRRIAAFSIGGAALACVVITSVPSPFVLLAGAGAILCAVVAWKGGRGWLRVVSVNACLVLLLFGAIEAAFGMLLTRRNRSFPEYPPQYFQPDDELGGAPQKGAAAHVTKRAGSAVVYDVNYTIGANGLRVSPPDHGTDAKACALFFGDSFMFGEGLADDQTIPWRVGALTNGDVRAFNFGFHGFGAQQMLAALQGDRVAKAADCRPTHIIYEAIPDHVARSAGYYSFMRHGPRYELEPNAVRPDSVSLRGHFDDAENNRSAIGAVIANAMAKSWVYRWLTSLSPQPDEDDLRRYVAIVTSAARVAATRYPGVRFDVLYWDIHGESPMDEKVLPALRAAGLNVFDAEQILPGFRENPSSFALSPYDAHPGARADDLLARYIVQQWFHRGGGATTGRIGVVPRGFRIVTFANSSDGT